MANIIHKLIERPTKPARRAQAPAPVAPPVEVGWYLKTKNGETRLVAKNLATGKQYRVVSIGADGKLSVRSGNAALGLPVDNRGHVQVTLA